VAAVHYGRRVRDEGSGEMIATTKCKTDGEFIEVTRRKEQVTCKRCLRKLVLESEQAPIKRRNRPVTAWDHLDAIPDDHTPVEEPEEVDVLPEPTPDPEPAPTHVFAGAAVGSAPNVFRLPERDPVVHRVALVFFNLMRLHLGVEQVTQLAEMASHGVVGQGRLLDNMMPLCEQLARLVLDPPQLVVNPR